MKLIHQPAHAHQKGFTLLELVIVIIMIGFLGTIVLDRLWKYRIFAEEAAVTATIGNIRSGLGLEVAKLAVRGQVQKIALFENTNPLMFLAQKPNNYIGEVTTENAMTEPGNWYYHASEKSLNYVVSYPENFYTNVSGIKRTRHQLKLVYTDNNNNGRFDKGVDDINGLDLIAMEPYRWVVEK